MRVATSVTYKTASLRDMERGIDLYNRGLYGCVKNPDLDDRARRMFASDWRKPDGLFVIQPEEVDAFLLPLPVGRLAGVGKVTGEKLEKLGIHTVADLRSWARR